MSLARVNMAVQFSLNREIKFCKELFYTAFKHEHTENIRYLNKGNAFIFSSLFLHKCGYHMEMVPSLVNIGRATLLQLV